MLGRGLCLILAASLAACSTAPITGRSQLNVLPEAQSVTMGLDAYEQIKRQTPISGDRAGQARIRRIGRDIVAAAQDFDPGYDWEFTLFKDDSANAFALPGGKVGVNTGLFDVARTDGQLAAVMAHEVAHALAKHGSERVSQQMVMQGGLAVLAGATKASSETAALMAQAATLGVVLPFSRTQESEADHIGLIFMARAGYDPSEAVDLWRNFRDAGGERPPEFLSTHPSPDNRIARLQALLPEACQVYRDHNGRRCAADAAAAGR
ncbi:peptidase M48-like protein [Rhodothalassium salexigens DSM 2132]|uniref:Peptidase M48-like protein n=2 Tax=Rhodothalassium salexigens TaxID=1086 RepID=A0A4R2PR04_RHOSA|nr:M48 family metallopeptidase [Rhodothalassium salexigens]TCP38273.1 peptidase M48-like protein [Rhodothalassium salexigens DSM 2132]